APSTPVTRKKQVTLSDKPGTSSSHTQKHEVHQKVQQTNIPVLPSIGVNDSTEASGSKPRSNTKKKKVEDHPRTNKEADLETKGKLSDSSLNKTKQVWKATGKLFANVKVALGKLNCGYQWRPTRKKFALGELCPSTKLSVQCCTGHPLVSGLRLFKTYDGESFKAQELCGKVHRDRQFYDSDLEVACRKHSCFVRNINGANLLKGSRSTNLYTISIDDMMKSS
ncbi:hypothetical protein Tco_0068525, partial [Tanacetum coccineum]